jgi:hypothetical protein
MNMIRRIFFTCILLLWFVCANAGTLTIYGDPAAGGNLRLESTKNATKGNIYLLGTITVDNGSTSGGRIYFQEKGSGTDKIQLICPDVLAADAIVYLPSVAGTLALVSGALGTPSFTDLNMPSANADPGTTPGQIRHDSTDTGSNAGGTAKWYDGAQVRSVVDTGTNYTIITKTEFLPIRYAEDGTTAPDAAAAVTGKTIIARNFAEAEDVVFFWMVPDDYIGGGPIKYRVHYALSTDGEANDTVTYSTTGCIVANSADIACSAGTALTISDELGTSDDQYEYEATDYSAESNADWGAVAGGLVKLGFSYAAAGDYTHDVLVIGIEIKYKAKVIGFAGY